MMWVLHHPQQVMVDQHLHQKSGIYEQNSYASADCNHMCWYIEGIWYVRKMYQNNRD
jgi:hypothetical protein